MSETISSRSGAEKSGENINGDYDKWKSLENEPFSGDDSAESDDYYIFDGEKYRNIDKIDISTEQGKYEWLDAVVENGLTRAETDLEKAKIKGYEDGDVEIDDANAGIKLSKREQKILEKIDINGDGGVIGALRREYTVSVLKLSELQKNGASESAINSKYEYFDAVSGLLTILEGEMSDRNVLDDKNSISKDDETLGEKVDISTKISEMEGDIAKREAALKVLESYDQRDYGDQTVAAIANLEQRKKDFDLLSRMLKRNDYNPEMTSESAKRMLDEMTTSRNKALVAIDKKIEKAEKGSDDWKKLKAERRKIYSRVPDESAERVLKDIFKLEI
ncbi:hypothetical protein IJI91_02665 [Candidatus Saccharibacteria bacterium]|nr:hypothetical protein [Candidatus Saccharibacteria bacterium]